MCASSPPPTRHLEDEIQKGNFREDLFYRLNVIPFFVPPLREHAEDIPALANFFLAEFARAYGRRPKHFSECGPGRILSYRWPGNVRELRNLVERLVIMVPGEKIERRHLPPSLSHDQHSFRIYQDTLRRASPPCRRRAPPTSATTSSARSRNIRAMSAAPPKLWAWSAATSTAK